MVCSTKPRQRYDNHPFLLLSTPPTTYYHPTHIRTSMFYVLHEAIWSRLYYLLGVNWAWSHARRVCIEIDRRTREWAQGHLRVSYTTFLYSTHWFLCIHFIICLCLFGQVMSSTSAILIKLMSKLCPYFQVIILIYINCSF